MRDRISVVFSPALQPSAGSPVIKGLQTTCRPSSQAARPKVSPPHWVPHRWLLTLWRFRSDDFMCLRVFFKRTICLNSHQWHHRCVFFICDSRSVPTWLLLVMSEVLIERLRSTFECFTDNKGGWCQRSIYVFTVFTIFLMRLQHTPCWSLIL